MCTALKQAISIMNFATVYVVLHPVWNSIQYFNRTIELIGLISVFPIVQTFKNCTATKMEPLPVDASKFLVFYFLFVKKDKNFILRQGNFILRQGNMPKYSLSKKIKTSYLGKETCWSYNNDVLVCQQKHSWGIHTGWPKKVLRFDQA